jgi:hypothetical protein
MNQLKVNQQETIKTLAGKGWSKRRIARELGLDRAMVRKYLRAVSKSPAPQTRSDPLGESKITRVQTGSDLSPASLCAPWRGEIEKALEPGLSIQRIYQDLVAAHGFTGSYHSVRRLALRLRPSQAELDEQSRKRQADEVQASESRRILATLIDAEVQKLKAKRESVERILEAK